MTDPTFVLDNHQAPRLDVQRTGTISWPTNQRSFAMFHCEFASVTVAVPLEPDS